VTPHDQLDEAGWARLPGSELVIEGLRDLAAGRCTVASTLVEVGAPKLRSLGIQVPPTPSPEHRLYAMLAERSSDDAHGRYNALLRRLVSFERALASARRPPQS